MITEQEKKSTDHRRSITQATCFPIVQSCYVIMY